MMNGLDVTAVLITRDRKESLLATLDHIAALTQIPPIIVVDNGSTDGTSEAVTRHHSDVQLIRSAVNLGAIARNVAVDKVTTSYVAFCDDDTHWTDGAMSHAQQWLDQWPKLASVTGRCLVEPELYEDPITPELRDSPVRGPKWLPGPALLGVMAGLSVFRTHAFRQVGGFHPRLWFGGEEELLAIDLASAGWWMCWNEDMIIHHAPSTHRDSKLRRWLGIRNTLWTAWLRRPWCAAARHSRSVLRSAPWDKTTIHAVWTALRGVPWVVRERRVVPAHVEEGLRALEKPRQESSARRYVD